jgi:hypothetical protein
MGIVRRVTAFCDAADLFEDGGTKDCFGAVVLKPEGTQPYIELERLGWATVIRDSKIHTVCPKHKNQVEELPEVKV